MLIRGLVLLIDLKSKRCSLVWQRRHSERHSVFNIIAWCGPVMASNGQEARRCFFPLGTDANKEIIAECFSEDRLEKSNKCGSYSVNYSLVEEMI